MKKFLMVHYSIKNQERWGRTFPLAKSLAKKGFEVTLLTTSNKKNRCILYNIETVDGVKIISLNDIMPKKLLEKGVGLISFFSRIIYSATHRFDFVYSDCSETPNAGWPCKLNQWIFRSIYISEWGDLLGKGGYYDSKPTWFKALFGWYYLWADFYFRYSANVIIVLSSYMKEYAIQRGIKEQKICIMPGGSLVDVIPKTDIDKSRLNINNGIITLGYIGINNREFKDLLPIINVLCSRKYKDRFKLVLFGEKVNIHNNSNCNINNIIMEAGWVDYYHDYSKLQAIDIFLLIKTDQKISNAGWPNKLGDYLAIGRPVMVTPYGDVSRFIEEYPGGFIPIFLNKESIEGEMDRLLNNFYDLKVMGDLNRAIAENVISWDSRVQNLIHFIDFACRLPQSRSN